MCVAGKSSQEGPGSHITRLLCQARGTFLLLERSVGPSQGGCGTTLAGCGGRGLCTRALDARLGVRGEESWGWGITVLRLALLRQERDVDQRRAAPFSI